MNLPSAEQHERALIGAMLIDSECREEALGIISASDFVSKRNQDVIGALEAIGEGDYTALISEMERGGSINGDSEEIDKYLLEIIDEVGTSAGYKRCCAKIKEAALRREILRSSEALSADARNYRLDVGDILEGQIGALNTIREQEQAVSEGSPGRRGLDACVVGFDQLLKMDIPERARLFPWLPEGGLSMVYGPRGIGKTYFTATLGAAVSSNIPFFKWGKPTKTAGVLFVDGEMPLSDFRERLTSLLIEQPVEPVKVISSEVVFSELELDINLVAEKQRNDVLKVLDADKAIRLVILDNISCLFSGLCESSKDDWEAITPWLLALRRRGVAVVLVHHAGKGGDQRGTSGREDILDTVIRLDKVQGVPDDGARFVVRFTKCRGAYGVPVEPFEASLDFKNQELWAWKPIEDSTYERMLNFAREGVDSVTDMSEELGVSKGLISRLKKKAQEAGDLLPGKFIQVPEDEI